MVTLANLKINIYFHTVHYNLVMPKLLLALKKVDFSL